MLKLVQSQVFKRASSGSCRLSSKSRIVATGKSLVSPLIGLNSDQAQFYSLAREFADNEMRPFAAKWEEDGALPMDTLKKLASLGFAGILIKDDIGGSALTRLDSTIIVEALATGCVGTTAMLTIHNMCGWMIDKYGTQEQRQRFLPDMCTFEKMTSYCLTEPSSGSDAASLRTTAVLDSKTNEYVINGGKAFISGAGTSDYYIVMCRTDPTAGTNGISAILVPKGVPGFTFGADENKLGWRVQPTRQLSFEDVRVPVTNLFGKPGTGFAMAMAGLDGGRLNIAACSLGAAQACFEIALDYVKERKQFGHTIASFQSTQFKLAELAGKLVSSRTLLRSAASLLDSGHPAASAHCALAKRMVTDTGFDIINDCLQMLGGYGYLKDYHIERYLRDVRVHQILEGTNEVMRHIVGKALVSDPKQ